MLFGRLENLNRIMVVLVVAIWSGSVYAAPGDLLFKLTAPDPQPGSHFGEVVAAADGNIVVGEPQRLVDNTAFVGQAYVFDAQTGAFKFTLEEPEPINRSTFGTSVAAGAGAVYIGGGAIADRGRVYSFDSNTGATRYQIDSPNGGHDNFAAAVAYGNGDLLVAASSYSLSSQLPFVGRAYLYDVATGQPKLTVPNPEPNAGDAFGFGAPLALFGDKFAIGCFADDGFDGRVWVLNRDSGQAMFSLDNPNPERPQPLNLADWFGFSVAANQHIIAVGAPEDDTAGPDGSGTVYVFDSITGALRHTLFSPQLEDNGEFGHSVAVTPEGNILVGAWGTSVSGIEAAGHVYLFDGQTGNLLSDIPNPEPSEFAQFGWSLAAARDRIVIGAQGGSADGLSTTGSVFVFASVPEPSTLFFSITLFSAIAVSRHSRTPSVFRSVVQVQGGRNHAFHSSTIQSHLPGIFTKSPRPAPATFDSRAESRLL
jgi:outer membrane protein assembly factor BamB